MTRQTRVGRVLLSVVFVACCGSLSVSAQAKRAEPADYQRLVQQGLHEYEAGNFSEAKVFFAQAHALSPNARTLRGLGMSSYELRHYVEAIGYFEGAMSSSERPLTPAMLGEVAHLLKQAHTFVTRLRVTLTPAAAELRIDTRPVAKDDAGFVLLDPGTHELVAEAPNYQSLTRTIRADGGEELSTALVLSPFAESNAQVAREAPAPAPQDAPVATPAPAETAAASSNVGPWIMMGAGAAVAIVGGVLLVLTLKDIHAVQHPSGEAPSYDSVKAAEARVYPESFAGFAALGVGAAGVIGGIAWKLATTDDGQERAGVSLDVLPGEVRLHGRF